MSQPRNLDTVASSSPRERWLLLGLTLLGLSLRLVYLYEATGGEGFAIDPDNYMRHGQTLAGDGEGWQWTFEVTRYVDGPTEYTLPPLYPVFLSLFALFSNYSFAALVGQSILSTLTIPLLYLLGHRLHGPGVGLVASGVYCLWLPNIIAVWAPMQESIYIPLTVLGFVLIARSLETSGRVPMLFAGLAFGAAALTRSMPMYFLPAAAVVLFVSAGVRKRVASQVLFLLLGFCVLTIPYSIALSRHLGQPIFIENHGTQRIAPNYDVPMERRPMTTADTASVLWNAMTTSPGQFVAEFADTARSVFHVNGGRLLQIYLSSSTKLGSRLWKLAVSLSDALLIVVVLLAPWGFARARNRPLAWLIAAWIAAVVVLTSLSGFGGARFRMPVEPHFILLTAALLAGGGRSLAPRAWLLASTFSAVLAFLLLPHVPASYRAQGEYGVDWRRWRGERVTTLDGQGGFNLFSRDGAVELTVRREGASESVLTHATVYVQGARVGGRVLRGSETLRLRHPWPARTLAYVEVEALDPETGESAPLRVAIPRRRN